MKNLCETNIVSLVWINPNAWNLKKIFATFPPKSFSTIIKEKDKNYNKNLSNYKVKKENLSKDEHLLQDYFKESYSTLNDNQKILGIT